MTTEERLAILKETSPGDVAEFRSIADQATEDEREKWLAAIEEVKKEWIGSLKPHAVGLALEELKARMTGDR